MIFELVYLQVSVDDVVHVKVVQTAEQLLHEAFDLRVFLQSVSKIETKLGIVVFFTCDSVK